MRRKGEPIDLVATQLTTVLNQIYVTSLENGMKNCLFVGMMRLYGGKGT